MGDLRVYEFMTRNITPSEQAVKRHLKHLALEGKSPYTIRRRDQALQRLAKALPGTLLDATPEQLYEWRAGMVNSNGTIACYLSHVKSFYKWAADNDLIPASPVTAVPVPRLGRRFPRPIPEPELMHAYSMTSHNMPVRQWLLLGAWCGMRVGEIAGLKVENLRLHDTPPVIIISEESAKGGKERIIELSPFVVTEIRAARLPSSGYAFTDANGHPLDPWFVSRAGNEHLRGSGSAATMHQLRHRFASQMYQATLDLRLVAELMGHSSQQTTANYAAFSRTGAAAAVASLPVPGGSPPELQEAS